MVYPIDLYWNAECGSRKKWWKYSIASILHAVGNSKVKTRNTSCHSPEVKPQFIKDAAYQAWVLDKCGVQLDGVFVVYHYDDEYDPFEPVDVTQEAIDYAQVIESNLDRLLQVKESKEEIMIPCGEQCDEPYGCWYKDYCSGLWNNN